jgi:ParE toxin of type II toxin-antitoxin system, parDE
MTGHPRHLAPQLQADNQNAFTPPDVCQAPSSAHVEPWLPVWLPGCSLTIISSPQHAAGLRKRWAQQGSNLRPLACKTRTYRRRTWLDVARRGDCQPRLWLDVAWHGLMPVDVGSPFGSPSSLAALTFSTHERQLWNSLRPPGHGDQETIDDRAPDLRRLRVGRYRVFYTIDEQSQTAEIDHVARLP